MLRAPPPEPPLPPVKLPLLPPTGDPGPLAAASIALRANTLALPVSDLRPKGPGDPGLMGMVDARALLPALAEPRLAPSRTEARPDPESERRDARAELLCRRPLARVNAGDSERWPLVDAPVRKRAGEPCGDAPPSPGEEVVEWHPTGLCWPAGLEIPMTPELVFRGVIVKSFSMKGWIALSTRSSSAIPLSMSRHSTRTVTPSNLFRCPAPHPAARISLHSRCSPAAVAQVMLKRTSGRKCLAAAGGQASYEMQAIAQAARRSDYKRCICTPLYRKRWSAGNGQQWTGRAGVCARCMWRSGQV